MAYDETAWHLLLGGVIGFVLGYFTCYLRSIKEELDEVKDELDQEHEAASRKRDEKGFMNVRLLRDAAVLFVVLLSAWASFVSQKASHDSINSQQNYEALVRCNTKTTQELITALNARAKYTVGQTSKNVVLVTSQGKFLSVVLHRPPYSEARRETSIRNYYKDLQQYLSVANKAVAKAKSNPFPTIEDFQTCLTLQANTEGK